MDGMSLTWGAVIMQVLGLPGLIFIIWHFDNKRFIRQEEIRKEEARIEKETRKKEMRATLDQYREDVSQIKSLYESNARLVMSTNHAYDRLEKLYGEAISVISLNTQTQANLVNAINNNQFCPVIRDKRRPEL